MTTAPGKAGEILENRLPMQGVWLEPSNLFLLLGLN
jgi:hypothetical protein